MTLNQHEINICVCSGENNFEVLGTSIGVGRFRILRGGGEQMFKILGEGANFQQAHDVVRTSM